MAKRKRLTPARPGFLDGPADGQRAPETKAMPVGMSAPIAQVASEASATAALEEVSAVLQEARAEGRMIELLDLEAIDDRHLVRDRLEQNEEEMASLVDSLRARGQQMPIEVVLLSDPRDGRTHGLVSGWRRLTALRRLYKETSDSKFAQVRAMVIAPETAQDAYVAMVEENEIRVNLSHYERARIAVRAMKEGVYGTQREALQGLFGNATRSKRSKIGSFVALVEAFDDALLWPSAISEKLGLALVREMGRDPGFEVRLKGRLKETLRANAGAEVEILSSALQEQGAGGAVPAARAQAPQSAGMGERIVSRPCEGVEMRFAPDRGRLELVGPGVTEALVAQIQEWLRTG